MKKITKFILSITITLVLGYFLLSKVNFSQIVEVLLKVNLFYYFLAAFFYIVLIIFRTLRIKTMLNLKFSDLFNLLMFTSFLNNVLPFKLGELSYTYLLKKKNKQSYKKGFSSLIVARVFDFIVHIGFLIFGIIISTNLPNKSDFELLIPFLIVSLFILATVVFIMIFLPDFTVKLFSKLFNFLPKFNQLKQFIKSFKNYKSSLLSTFFYSIAIYFSRGILNYFLIISLGFSLPLDVIIVVITFSVLSSFLPINGIANFGTRETVWTVILIYYGFTLESAVLLSFGTHILQLFYVSLIGFYSWLKISL